jgi:GNAT superfamily N-acetyltransferase
MFVEPAHRRAGVARALLEACVAWGRKQGYTRIALHASDAGRPLYAAMGFRPSSEMWLDPSP